MPDLSKSCKKIFFNTCELNIFKFSLLQVVSDFSCFTLKLLFSLFNIFDNYEGMYRMVMSENITSDVTIELVTWKLDIVYNNFTLIIIIIINFENKLSNYRSKQWQLKLYLSLFGRLMLFVSNKILKVESLFRWN